MAPVSFPVPFVLLAISAAALRDPASLPPPTFLHVAPIHFSTSPPPPPPPSTAQVKYINPSYMIRSVPATADDSYYCSLLGQGAVHAAMAGYTGESQGAFSLERTQVHPPCSGHDEGRAQPAGLNFAPDFITMKGVPRPQARIPPPPDLSGFSIGLVNNHTVLLPIPALVAKSPRTMNKDGRTWERVLGITHQPDARSPATAKPAAAPPSSGGGWASWFGAKK